MEDKNIIDYGSWAIPESWEEITLYKYQEIERFYEDKDEPVDIRKIVHILCDKTIDDVNQLPVEFLDKILKKLSFIQELPKTDKPTNKIEIDGITYQVNTQNKLKAGEYIAAETTLKNDRHNYAALLAILCRKQDELYDSKFENEILEERIKLFEKQPIIKILPITSFFLDLWIISEMPTLLSTKVKEELNRTANNIETLGKNGAISKRSMKSLTKKLKKLEKSINSI